MIKTTVHETSTQKREAMNAVRRMKVKSSTLAFCVCSYSACESQRGRHGQKGGGGGEKEEEEEEEGESSLVKWDSSLRCR